MFLLPVLIPLIGGLSLLFFTPKSLSRHCYAVVGMTAIVALILPFYEGSTTLGYFPLGVELTLRVDEIGHFFSWIFVGIWLCVLRYSFSYLQDDPKKQRFFAFFLATLGAVIGVSYAANFITLYLCFELVSLCCFPLIAHVQTEESMRACKKYLFYSLAGALIGLVAIFHLYSLPIDPTFTPGGIAGIGDVASQQNLLILLAVTTLGFGCKAGLFPLHGWLKTAHPIAPAPASAVLSGITTKVGVIAILRMIYYVIGPDLIAGTQMQTVLLCVALLTIFMGSMLAYREKILKTRLAYSTVSQVSYILFALLLCNPIAFVGALLHVLFHALAKNSLFLCAGTVIHQTDIHDVAGLRGLGRGLRPTFVLFTVASLSLVGVPFTAGFVSKWYLAVGALEHPLGIWGVSVLMISALLTAGYLLSIAWSALMVSDDQMVEGIVPAPSTMTAPTLAIFTVILGCYPTPVITFLTAIAGKIF